MYDVVPWLPKTASTSVKFGNLIIPFRSLPNHIRPFVEPAVFFNKSDSPFQYSKGGSLTKLKIGQKYIAVATHHQFAAAAYSYDQIAIFGSDGKTLHTANTIHFIDEEKEIVDEFDVVFADFSEAVSGGMISKASWYDVTPQIKLNKVQAPIVHACVGYPSEINDIDYDAGSFGATPYLVWGDLKSSMMHGRKCFSPLHAVEFDPEGMSGGGVFGLSLARHQLELRFYGILTNASKKNYNYICFSRLHGLFGKIL
jgi:hypothetical protein